jgi:hypothetical protein
MARVRPRMQAVVPCLHLSALRCLGGRTPILCLLLTESPGLLRCGPRGLPASLPPCPLTPTYTPLNQGMAKMAVAYMLHI